MVRVVSAFVCILVFLIADETANAVKRSDCGANLFEVNEILARKFPTLDAKFLNGFLGTWVYPGYAPMIIAKDRPFEAMGYQLLICPQEDKSFLVYWKKDGSRAGTLGMNGRNRITIYQTSYGDIPLDRAGSATAGR